MDETVDAAQERGLGDVAGSVHIDATKLLDASPCVYTCGAVKNPSDIVARRVDGIAIGDVGGDDLEPIVRQPAQVGIRRVLGHHQGANPPTVGEQAPHDRLTDEPGRTGDEAQHGIGFRGSADRITPDPRNPTPDS